MQRRNAIAGADLGGALVIEPSSRKLFASLGGSPCRCLELDTRAREIRAAMKGIRKTYAAPQTQAEALKPAMVRGVLATPDDTPLDRRYAAPVALLFAGALRRSEIVGLDGVAGDGAPPRHAVVLGGLRMLPASPPHCLRAADRWGPDASGNMLRRSARCSKCGRKGAALQHPSWAGMHIGFEPFPHGSG